MTDKSQTTVYPSGDRWICSHNHPWRPGLPTPVVHPSCREVGRQDNGHGGGRDTVTMYCDVCHTEWTMPQ